MGAFDTGYSRKYKDAMGIQVNGTAIPDPSSWNYQVGDLDTEGGRDATGLLHRAYVATKVNYEFSWNALDWKMLQHILALVNTPKFTLKAPDPRTFNTYYTGNYYVGDRTGKAYYYRPVDQSHPEYEGLDEIAQFDLKLKFIEY